MKSREIYYLKQRKVYRGKITYLGPNDVFVCGTNIEGRHGRGSALYAKQNFGAILGRAMGMMGQTYGIVTKDIQKSYTPSINKKDIGWQILMLYHYARANEDKNFFVAYTAEDNNLNGYTSKEMAELFNWEPIPENIIFEEEFAKLMQ